MASEERQELLDKANALSLDFPDNIPSKKLQAMIDEALGNDTQTEEDKEQDQKEAPKKLSRRQFIAERKRAAMATKVVTITNKDPRENDVATTAPLSFENQHYSVAKNVPLDVPVELEQALINVAESTIITLHKDEVINGKRTGNKIPVPVNKYIVSYSNRKPD
ncbi:hypothetical protein vBAmePPT11V19_00021 [Alteromonas phage vB_AmeP_PT11-V19]|nr:hypothetical protein vBAmePPT11V19_00021 [Alteromonas phage vB_AmeP_PT11-V19]